MTSTFLWRFRRRASVSLALFVVVLLLFFFGSRPVAVRQHPPPVQAATCLAIRVRTAPKFPPLPILPGSVTRERIGVFSTRNHNQYENSKRSAGSRKTRPTTPNKLRPSISKTKIKDVEKRRLSTSKRILSASKRSRLFTSNKTLLITSGSQRVTVAKQTRFAASKKRKYTVSELSRFTITRQSRLVRVKRMLNCRSHRFRTTRKTRPTSPFKLSPSINKTRNKVVIKQRRSSPKRIISSTKQSRRFPMSKSTLLITSGSPRVTVAKQTRLTSSNKSRYKQTRPARVKRMQNRRRYRVRATRKTRPTTVEPLEDENRIPVVHLEEETIPTTPDEEETFPTEEDTMPTTIYEEESISPTISEEDIIPVVHVVEPTVRTTADLGEETIPISIPEEERNPATVFDEERIPATVFDKERIPATVFDKETIPVRVSEKETVPPIFYDAGTYESKDQTKHYWFQNGHLFVPCETEYPHSSNRHFATTKKFVLGSNSRVLMLKQDCDSVGLAGMGGWRQCLPLLEAQKALTPYSDERKRRSAVTRYGAPSDQTFVSKLALGVSAGSIPVDASLPLPKRETTDLHRTTGKPKNSSSSKSASPPSGRSPRAASTVCFGRRIRHTFRHSLPRRTRNYPPFSYYQFPDLATELANLHGEVIVRHPSPPAYFVPCKPSRNLSHNRKMFRPKYHSSTSGQLPGVPAPSPAYTNLHSVTLLPILKYMWGLINANDNSTLLTLVPVNPSTSTIIPAAPIATWSKHQVIPSATWVATPVHRVLSFPVANATAPVEYLQLNLHRRPPGPSDWVSSSPTLPMLVLRLDATTCGWTTAVPITMQILCSKWLLNRVTVTPAETPIVVTTMPTAATSSFIEHLHLNMHLRPSSSEWIQAPTILLSTSTSTARPTETTVSTQKQPSVRQNATTTMATSPAASSNRKTKICPSESVVTTKRSIAPIPEVLPMVFHKPSVRSYVGSMDAYHQKFPACDQKVKFKMALQILESTTTTAMPCFKTIPQDVATWLGVKYALGMATKPQIYHKVSFCNLTTAPKLTAFHRATGPLPMWNYCAIMTTSSSSAYGILPMTGSQLFYPAVSSGMAKSLKVLGAAPTTTPPSSPPNDATLFSTESDEDPVHAAVEKLQQIILQMYNASIIPAASSTASLAAEDNVTGLSSGDPSSVSLTSKSVDASEAQPSPTDDLSLAKAAVIKLQNIISEMLVSTSTTAVVKSPPQLSSVAFKLNALVAASDSPIQIVSTISRKSVISRDSTVSKKVVAKLVLSSATKMILVNSQSPLVPSLGQPLVIEAQSSQSTVEPQVTNELLASSNESPVSSELSSLSEVDEPSVSTESISPSELVSSELLVANELTSSDESSEFSKPPEENELLVSSQSMHSSAPSESPASNEKTASTELPVSVESITEPTVTINLPGSSEVSIKLAVISQKLAGLGESQTSSESPVSGESLASSKLLVSSEPPVSNESSPSSELAVPSEIQLSIELIASSELTVSGEQLTSSELTVSSEQLASSESLLSSDSTSPGEIIETEALSISGALTISSEIHPSGELTNSGEETSVSKLSSVVLAVSIEPSVSAESGLPNESSKPIATSEVTTAGESDTSSEHSAPSESVTESDSPTSGETSSETSAISELPSPGESSMPSDDSSIFSETTPQNGSPETIKLPITRKPSSLLSNSIVTAEVADIDLNTSSPPTLSSTNPSQIADVTMTALFINLPRNQASLAAPIVNTASSPAAIRVARYPSVEDNTTSNPKNIEYFFNDIPGSLIYLAIPGAATPKLNLISTVGSVAPSIYQPPNAQFSLLPAKAFISIAYFIGATPTVSYDPETSPASSNFNVEEFMMIPSAPAPSIFALEPIGQQLTAAPFVFGLSETSLDWLFGTASVDPNFSLAQDVADSFSSPGTTKNAIASLADSIDPAVYSVLSNPDMAELLRRLISLATVTRTTSTTARLCEACASSNDAIMFTKREPYLAAKRQIFNPLLSYTQYYSHGCTYIDKDLPCPTRYERPGKKLCLPICPQYVPMPIPYIYKLPCEKPLSVPGPCYPRFPPIPCNLCREPLYFRNGIQPACPPCMLFPDSCQNPDELDPFHLATAHPLQIPQPNAPRPFLSFSVDANLPQPLIPLLPGLPGIPPLPLLPRLSVTLAIPPVPLLPRLSANLAIPPLPLLPRLSATLAIPPLTLVPLPSVAAQLGLRVNPPQPPPNQPGRLRPRPRPTY